MGLAADLGYRIPSPNFGQRGLQAVASTAVGAWVFSKLARRLDDLVGRIARGNTTASEALAGLLALDVTTIGRRSGLRRTSHLIAVPFQDTLALLGTNFGQASTPAWVLNLEADPRATLRHRSVTLEAVARPASEAERTAVLEQSAQVYGGYMKYQQRITGRRLRIFVLEPADPHSPGR